jgi:hypothetical protein
MNYTKKYEDRCKDKGVLFDGQWTMKTFRKYFLHNRNYFVLKLVEINELIKKVNCKMAINRAQINSHTLIVDPASSAVLFGIKYDNH